MKRKATVDLEGPRTLRKRQKVDYTEPKDFGEDFGLNKNYGQQIKEYNKARAGFFSSKVDLNPQGTIVKTRKELSGTVQNSFLSASGAPSKSSQFWVKIQNTEPGKKRPESFSFPYYVSTGSDGALYPGRAKKGKIVGFEGKGEGNYTSLMEQLKPIEKSEGTSYINKNLVRGFLQEPMQAKREHLSTLHEFAMVQRYEDVRTKYSSGKKLDPETRLSSKLHLREQMMSNKSIESRYSPGGTFKGVESAKALREAKPNNKKKTQEAWAKLKMEISGTKTKK